MASGLLPSAFFTAVHASQLLRLPTETTETTEFSRSPSPSTYGNPARSTLLVAYIIETNRIALNLKKTSVAFLEMEPHIMSGDMDQVEKCEQTIQRAVDCIGEVLHTINPAYRTTVLSNALRGAYTSSPNITEWYPDMMSLYMNRAEELDREVASDNSNDDEPNMEVVHLETLASVKALEQAGTEDASRKSYSNNDNIGNFETLFPQSHYQILYRNPFDASEDPRPYIIL